MTLPHRVQARQFEWAKAHEEHKKVEEMAETLAAKLEAIEKDKEANRRRLHVSAVAPRHAPRSSDQPPHRGPVGRRIATRSSATQPCMKT